MKKAKIVGGSVVGLLMAGAALSIVMWWRAAPREIAGETLILRPVATSLRFFAVGDTGTGNTAQLAVAARMEERCKQGLAPTAILLLGDNFYMDGAKSLDDPQWEQKVWRPYGSACLSQLPIYVVLGNHDYRTNPGVQIEMSRRNPRWVLPSRNYAVRFGDLLEIDAFDSNLSDYCFSSSRCTKDFLFVRFGASPPPRWRIAMAHHPIISASTKHTDEKNGFYRAWVGPTICSGADVMLSGHSHHLEEAVMKDCRTRFFIAGGGGGDLYAVREGKEGSLFARSSHGFLDFTVEDGKLAAALVSDRGEELHRTEILKKD